MEETEIKDTASYNIYRLINHTHKCYKCLQENFICNNYGCL